MEFERIYLEELDKLPKSRCAKLVETPPSRLEAITAKYQINGINTFVNEIFQFLIFDKVVQISKNTFSLCLQQNKMWKKSGGLNSC